MHLGNVAAFFYYTGGPPLVPIIASPLTPQYTAPDGHLVVSQDFTPGYDSTDYNDLQLFMPYSGLGNGEPQSLMYHVDIFDKDSYPPNALTLSGWHFFKLCMPC